MAKLVLSSGGTVIQQYFVDKERISIGRDTQNQVVIDDPAVSREHATITTIGNDQILEDLKSSNGTVVNGARIARHILQHGDVVELGPYTLRYLNPKLSADISLERTMLIEPLEGSGQTKESGMAPESLSGTGTRAANVNLPKGSVKILYGPNAHKVMKLNRVVATFGKEGEQLAVITRRPMGYFITHVVGARFPRVNNATIGKEPRALKSNDVIEVAGETLEFLLDQ